MSWVACQICIFRAKFLELGKPCLPTTQRELPIPGASLIMRAFLMYDIRAPPLVGITHTYSHIFTKRRSQAVPQTARAQRLSLGSCAALRPRGPCGISHSSVRTAGIPFSSNFLPINVSSHPWWNFLSFLSTRVRHTFPILPSSHCTNPFTDTRSGFMHVPFSAAVWGPHVPHIGAGAFRTLYFQHPYLSNAHNSQAPS